MNRYDDNLATGNEARPGWFKRNWLWFIPVIVLLPVLCCCGGGGALIYFGLGVLFESPAYQDTIAQAEAHPTIQQEIGTPIDWPEGFMDLVNIENGGGSIDLRDSGGSMIYEATLPVSGPNGSGTLRIEADSTDNVNWNYTIREFEIDATGEVIDLMPGAGNTDVGLPESE